MKSTDTKRKPAKNDKYPFSKVLEEEALSIMKRVDNIPLRSSLPTRLEKDIAHPKQRRLDGKYEKQKKRFPYEIFSAGKSGKRKSIPPELEELPDRRAVPIQEIHKSSSIAELVSRNPYPSPTKPVTVEEMKRLKEDCSKILQSEYPPDMLKRNCDQGFLPNIRSLEKAHTQSKGKAQNPIRSESQIGSQSIFSLQTLSGGEEQSGIKSEFFQSHNMRKGSAGRYQIANLELLAMQIRKDSEPIKDQYAKNYYCHARKERIFPTISQAVSKTGIQSKLQPFDRNSFPNSIASLVGISNLAGSPDSKLKPANSFKSSNVASIAHIEGPFERTACFENSEEKTSKEKESEEKTGEEKASKEIICVGSGALTNDYKKPEYRSYALKGCYRNKANKGDVEASQEEEDSGLANLTFGDMKAGKK